MNKTKAAKTEQSGVDGFGTFTDKRDGQMYRIVRMPDGEIWMAQNLNYKPESGNSWCYNDDESMGDKYGRLYDWETAMTVVPAGWHLPSLEEWYCLKREILGCKEELETVGKKLKSKSGWDDYEGKSGNGTDDYGFSALPSGERYPDGSFDGVGEEVWWWMATERRHDRACAIYIQGDTPSEHCGNEKSMGDSVRCVQNK